MLLAQGPLSKWALKDIYKFCLDYSYYKCQLLAQGPLSKWASKDIYKF